MNLERYLDVSPEVKAAIEAGKPVVALESTIISHGMPYPQNVETALNVERIVRESGAVPATIAIIQGKMHRGHVTPEQIEHLGKKGLAVTKASRRDLPVLLSRGEDGATTVTTTMIGAASGGHPSLRHWRRGRRASRRGNHHGYLRRSWRSWRRPRCMVVCAGSQIHSGPGPDAGISGNQGRARHRLPHRRAARLLHHAYRGFGVDYRLDTPGEIAGSSSPSSWTCGLPGGMLVTNPIPDEYAMDLRPYERATSTPRHRRGRMRWASTARQTTPFLLDKIQKLTGGDSLKANIQLVYNNARLGAQIATELAGR